MDCCLCAWCMTGSPFANNGIIYECFKGIEHSHSGPCGRAPAENVGSNTARGMDVCLF
jgi:hypothetical protein